MCTRGRGPQVRDVLWGLCRDLPVCQSASPTWARRGSSRRLAWPQSCYGCIRKEDIRAIAFCVFTRCGQSACFISPWEFERFPISCWPGDTPGASYRLSGAPKLTRHDASPGVIRPHGAVMEALILCAGGS